MTYFNIDPKPKNYTHPNGVTGISKVVFGAAQGLIPIIKELCDDPMLELVEGEGIKSFSLTPESFENPFK